MELAPGFSEEDFNPGYSAARPAPAAEGGSKPEWQHTQDYWGEKDEIPGVSRLDGPGIPLRDVRSREPLADSGQGARADRQSFTTRSKLGGEEHLVGVRGDILGGVRLGGAKPSVCSILISRTPREQAPRILPEWSAARSETM